MPEDWIDYRQWELMQRSLPEPEPRVERQPD